MKSKAVLLLLIMMIAITLTTFGETHVLIMGAGDYKHDSIIRLPGAIEDARKLKNIVIKLKIADEENITYIENPVKTDIEIELEKLITKGKKDDLLIFYFAGHSQTGINESGRTDTYLCGIDVRKDYLQRTAYNFREDFERIAGKLKAGQTIMVFGVSTKLLGI